MYRKPIGAGLGAAVVYLIAAQAWLSPSYGWWHDELYSLWASDPSSPLQRLVLDSNPPLYFVALRLVRFVVADERLAALAVLVAAVSGLLATRQFLIDEPTWANAALVHELGRDCGPGTIAVPAYSRLYATAAHLPESTFVVSTPACQR